MLNAEEHEKILAREIKGRFTGDPSFKYICKIKSKKHNQGDNANFEDKYIKEEIRLSVVVEDISKEAFIIPNNAESDYNSKYFRNFKGLSEQNCKKLENWKFSEGSETKDTPNKMNWSVQTNSNSVILSNLYWIGAYCITVPNCPIYSKIYVGNGEKNLDLPFML